MPYSQNVVRRARQRLENLKSEKQSLYRARLFEVYERLPQVRTIDMQLRASMTQAAQAAFTKGEDGAAAIEKVKQENLALQSQRKALIDANFPEGFLDEAPFCPHCGGVGYLGSTMCQCLKQLCALEQRNEIAMLTTGAENFQALRLDVYPDTVDARFGVSPRTVMERNFRIAKRFADTFGQGGHLLFVGGTGLGKTFLSACIANEVADQGFSVCYESAPALFAKLEKNRFDPDDDSRADARAMEVCDLLIIDDLGTELAGNFVTAALYALVNDRLLNNKSMVISTNLTIEEIARRYSPQIASRMQGSFRMLPFAGEDIRVMKL